MPGFKTGTDPPMCKENTSCKFISLSPTNLESEINRANGKKKTDELVENSGASISRADRLTDQKPSSTLRWTLRMRDRRDFIFKVLTRNAFNQKRYKSDLAIKWYANVVKEIRKEFHPTSSNRAEVPGPRIPEAAAGYPVRSRTEFAHGMLSYWEGQLNPWPHTKASEVKRETI